MSKHAAEPDSPISKDLPLPEGHDVAGGDGKSTASMRTALAQLQHDTAKATIQNIRA